MEIRSILFPTDFSAVANSAFPLAATLCARLHAKVVALNVATGAAPKSIGGFPEPPDRSDLIIEEVSVSAVDADPADVIMREAESRCVGLIVMASHGRSDVAQFFLGSSVAERVARDSPLPTIIARLHGPRRTSRPIDRFGRIVFATDLAPDSRMILPAAALIARATGARLDVLCVFGEGDEQPADSGRERIRRYFDEADVADQLGEVTIARAGVADAVVGYAAASETDLLAITTTLCCGGDPKMTDVAEFIIRHAPCPVLCIRP